MINIKEKIFEQKIIGIIRGIDKNKIIEAVESLVDGGIDLLEIALNQDSNEKCDDVVEMIGLVSDKFAGRVCLGAGTVISADQVEKVVDAGAEYIISPNIDREVIEKTKELNKISIPGAYTPSEIIKAYKMGADFVKLFPAKNLGPNYIKAVLAPISNIPILAVGGIDINNFGEFISAGVVGVGLGGSLVDNEVITSGDFDIIKKKAEDFVMKSKQVEMRED